MTPTSGTIEINGKEYAWRSPRLMHLVEVENLVGPITDLKVVNSVRGRAYLAYECLRDDNPNITARIILDWPASTFSELWELIRKAVPIYGGAGASEVGQPVPPALPAEEAGSRPDQQASPNGSSSPSSEGPAGIPNAPESSG